MSQTPIMAPANYVPSHAVAFSDSNANALLVSASQPMPVAHPSDIASPTTPLTGTISANGSAGPFVPQVGREIWRALSGT